MTVSEIWGKATEWFTNFFLTAEPIVDDLITTVFAPIKDVLPRLGVAPDFPDWIDNILLPIIGNFSIFNLMLGGGVTFFIGYTLVKWIVGIVTGS